MSSIDQRIVEMQFNNRQFQSGVSETMSILDRLKEKLNFSSAKNGLLELQNAGRAFTLDGIASAVNSISDKFSMLGMIGVTAMQKIANAAVNAGTQLVKSLSVDQISAGMQKYEQETNAVASMFYAVKRHGYSLEDVYETLGLLADYADETSYSYSQMTDAMAKFTANGIDLKESEVMIEGIANAAAKAGVNIHEAGPAFKNFSDALSVGHFMIKDWMSIQNIHMDTEEFREEVIKAAIAVGALNEQGEILASGGKWEKVTVQNFREMLRYGFFNTATMKEVLKKYANREEDFGKEAFEAAKLARTFSDVIDATADSVSSQWRNTFRMIFGDLNEATELWTWLVEALIDFTWQFDEARNAAVKFWKDAGGRTALINGIQNAWATLTTTFTKLLSSFKLGAFDTGFVLTGQGLLDLTKKFENFTVKFDEWLNGSSLFDGGVSSRFHWISQIVEGVGSFASIFIEGGKAVGTFAKEVFKQLLPGFDGVLQVVGQVSEKFNGFMRQIRMSGKLTKLAKDLAEALKPITSRIPGMLHWVEELLNKIEFFFKTDSDAKFARDNWTAFFRALVYYLPHAVEGAINLVKQFYDLIKETDEFKAIESTIRSVGRSFIQFSGRFAQSLIEFMNVDTSGAGSLWEKLKLRFAVFDWIGPWIQQKWRNIRAKFPFLEEIHKWLDEKGVFRVIRRWWDGIKEAFDAFMGADISGETSIFGKLKVRFKAMWDSLAKLIGSEWERVKKRFPKIAKISKFFTDLWEKIFPKKVDKNGKAVTVGDTFKAIFGKIGEAVKWILKNVTPGNLLKIAGLAFIIKKVIGVVKTITGVFKLPKALMELIGGAGDIVENINKSIKQARVNAKIRDMALIAGSIFVLGLALEKLSKLTWEEIAHGLAAMGGIFLETGGFMVALGWLKKAKGIDVANLRSNDLLALAASIFILGEELQRLSQLTWGEIAKGLTAIGGIFVETGGFMVAIGWLKKAKGIKAANLSAKNLLGLAASVYLLGEELQKLSKMTWGEILTGLGAMGGIFVEEFAFFAALTFLQKHGFTNDTVPAAGLVALGANIQLFGDELKKLSDMSWDEIKTGLLAMGGIFAEEFAFFAALTFLQNKGFTASSVPTAGLLAIAGNLYLVGEELQKLAKLEWEEIKRGLTAMAGILAVDGVFALIAAGVTALGGISWPAIAAIGVIGILIDLLVELATKMMAGLSDSIAVIGSNFAQFDEVIKNINVEKIKEVTAGMRAASGDLAIIGLRYYGNVNGFSTELTRMGAALVLFSGLTANFNSEKAKEAIKAVSEMSADLAGITAVDDVSNTIANIGGAIKLYAESVNGVTFDSAPDPEAVKSVFTALSSCLPDDETVAAVSEYGTDQNGKNLNQFAIGLTNIATAVSDFSKACTEVEIGDMTDVTNILGKINSFNTTLGTTAVAHFGPFALEVKAQTSSLNDFSKDLIVLGEAVTAFNTYVGTCDITNMDAAVTVLGKIKDINKELPKTGGISEWITGSQNLTRFATNLRLLGGGAKAFGEAISGTPWGTDNLEAAGAALTKIAEINAKLPKTGGFVQIFTGSQSLENFANNLGGIGSGIAAFVTGLGDVTVGKNAIDALEQVTKIAELQIELADKFSNGEFYLLAEDLKNSVEPIKEFNTGLNEITDWADATAYQDLMSKTIDAFGKLQGIQKGQVNLKALGNDIKDFFNAVKNINIDQGQTRSEWLLGIGESLKGAFDSISSSVDTLATGDKAISSKFTAIMDSSVEAVSSRTTDFDTQGTAIANALTNGIFAVLAGINKPSTLFGNAISAAVATVNSYQNSFATAGGHLVRGLVIGIRNNKSEAIQEAEELALKMLTRAQKVLGIESPSKEFEKIGMYSDMGLANGIERYSRIVTDSAASLSMDALNVVSDTMSSINNLNLDALDFTPTIRPVVDTEYVESGLKGINARFGDSMYTKMHGIVMSKFHEQVQVDSAENTARGFNTLSERMDKLSQDILDMTDTMSNLQVRMDTGALVGAIEPTMNRKMYNTMVRSERG